jgi:hypothetical protein
VCFLDGAAAIAHDASPKIQRYYGGYSADNGGSALQCVIRNLKGEKFFVSLGDVNGISVREHHENIPPSCTKFSTTASLSTFLIDINNAQSDERLNGVNYR